MVEKVSEVDVREWIFFSDHSKPIINILRGYSSSRMQNFRGLLPRVLLGDEAFGTLSKKT